MSISASEIHLTSAGGNARVTETPPSSIKIGSTRLVGSTTGVVKRVVISLWVVWMTVAIVGGRRVVMGSSLGLGVVLIGRVVNNDGEGGGGGGGVGIIVGSLGVGGVALGRSLVVNGNLVIVMGARVVGAGGAFVVGGVVLGNIDGDGGEGGGGVGTMVVSNGSSVVTSIVIMS